MKEKTRNDLIAFVFYIVGSLMVGWSMWVFANGNTVGILGLPFAIPFFIVGSLFRGEIEQKGCD